MLDIPRNYYSNLSCYEDFVLRTNLLGYDVSDEVVLQSLTKVNVIDPYYWFVIGEEENRHICMVDKHGDRVENAVLNGDFNCSNCNSLTTLEGAPREVGGYFDCSGCDSLKSFHGSPQSVGRNFYCLLCKSLVSLDEITKNIGGKIYLNYGV